MSKTDLHIHSRFSSDGTFGVREIIEKCIANGVDTFSISDHNSVRGLEEANAIATEKGIGFIPGIEIDCNFEGIDLHVLGYNIDRTGPDFKALEDDIAQKVTASFDGMIRNLHRLGFAIEADEVLKHAGGQLPTGELIAEVMLGDEKYAAEGLHPYMPGGARSDMPYINFYLDFFAQGKPAHTPIDYMTFADAISLITRNGGTPVVAHPGLNLRGREQLVERLLDNGAQGMEVFNNYHDAGQIGYFASLARQRNVLMTCGGDFHGKTKPLIEIGSYSFDPEYLDDAVRSVRKLKAADRIKFRRDFL